MCLLQEHISYSYEAPAYIDSDSQSSSSQYQEYQDSPSPSSDRGGRNDRDSLPLAPLSGIHTRSSPHVHQNSQQYKTFMHVHTPMYASLSYLYLHPLPPWQERGRSACSSSCLRCSRHHRCGAASGGSNPLSARSSSPPKTRSAWRSCGAGERVIARPWPTRRWRGRWGTTPAQARFERWRGSSPTGSMRRHWEAYKETLIQCRTHDGECM